MVRAFFMMEEVSVRLRTDGIERTYFLEIYQKTGYRLYAAGPAEKGQQTMFKGGIMQPDNIRSRSARADRPI
jgi:hypothetical protein